MLINFAIIDQTILDHPEWANDIYDQIQKVSDQSLSLEERKQAIDFINEKTNYLGIDLTYRL